MKTVLCRRTLGDSLRGAREQGCSGRTSRLKTSYIDWNNTLISWLGRLTNVKMTAIHKLTWRCNANSIKTDFCCCSLLLGCTVEVMSWLWCPVANVVQHSLNTIGKYTGNKLGLDMGIYCKATDIQPLTSITGQVQGLLTAHFLTLPVGVNSNATLVVRGLSENNNICFLGAHHCPTLLLCSSFSLATCSPWLPTDFTLMYLWCLPPMGRAIQRQEFFMVLIIHCCVLRIQNFTC